MESFTTDTWAEGGPGHYTHQETMYMNFLTKLVPSFKGGKVLEIGPGTGEFAKRMLSSYPITSYTVLDLEVNIFDSVNNVNSEKLNYVFAQNYRNLFDIEFDLIVSNVCIPETPKEYRENLLNNIIPKCSHAMIIGQLAGDWVEGSEYEDWIKKLFDNNFEIVHCELTPYKNCYALTGSDSKTKKK